MTLTLPKISTVAKKGNSNNVIKRKRELAGGHNGGWMFVWSVDGYVGERMGRLVSSGRIDR